MSILLCHSAIISAQSYGTVFQVFPSVRKYEDKVFICYHFIIPQWYCSI